MSEAAGRQAYRLWATHPLYAMFPNDTPPEIAIKHFMPPAAENMTQIAQPMTAERKAFLVGWQLEKTEQEGEKG